MTRLYPYVTDHVTALKQYYAEDEKKREKFGTQLVAQGVQKQKAVEAASPVKALAGLASLSKTVRTGLATVEAKKTKADTKYQKEISNMLSMNPVLTKELTDYIVDKTNDYEGERKNIFKDSKFLDPVIKNLAAKDKEALQALLKHDPRRMIILQETLARRFATQLPGRAEDHESELKGEGKWFDKNAAGEDIPLTKEEELQRLQDFKAAELAKFGISTESIAAIASGELRRQNETLRGTKTSLVDSQLFKENRALELDLFKTSAGSIEPKALGDTVEKVILSRAKTDFTDITGGPSAIQQATESVVADLIRLGDAGFIPNGALAGLEDYEFEHPAGKDGKASVIDAFFAKDSKHFKRIVDSIDRGQNKTLGVQTAKDQETYAKAVYLAQQGKQDEADELMRPLIGRDLLAQEQYADYKRINPVEQSKSYENDRDEYYTDLNSRGKLPSLEELRAEPNEAMKKKWVAIKEAEIKWKSENEYSYNIKLFQNEVYKLRTTRALEPGQPITQEDGAVVQKLVDFSEMRLSYYLEQDRINGTKTPNIAALIKQDVDTFKVGNGWGTEEGGMFSLDKSDTGDHKWANINKVDLDLGSQGQYFHNRPSPNRAHSYNVRLRNYRGKTKEERWKMPQSIFSNRQMLGFKENGYFSDDMKYIAAREGLTLNKAFSLALNSMDSDFAKLHNFKQLPEEAKANLKAHSFIAETLDKGVEALLQLPEESRDMRVLKPAIRNLKYKLKYQGWDSFTLKDKEMLIKIGRFVTPDDIKEEAEQDSNEFTHPTRQKVASDALTALEDK